MVQGSKITPLHEISPKFKDAEERKEAALHQQRTHTPDQFKGNTQNHSLRPLCSSPPLPMVGDPSLFSNEHIVLAPRSGERVHRYEVNENHPTEAHEVHDHIASVRDPRLSDINLGDEIPAPALEEYVEDPYRNNSQTIPPPVPHEPRTAWSPRSQHESYIHDMPYRASKPNLTPLFLHKTFSKVLGDPKTTFIYLFLAILSTFLIYALIYGVTKLLPLYHKLHDLKDKLASFDAFKDKVAAKLGSWLDDGKSMADNVKEQAKKYADIVVVELNKVLGKVGRKLKIMDVGERNSVVSSVGATTTAVPSQTTTALPTILLPGSSDTLEVLMSELDEKKVKTRSKNEEPEAGNCGGRNWTSFALGRRIYLPLPFIILGSLIRLVHSGPIGCSTSIVTTTSTLYLAPSIYPRASGFQDCDHISNIDELRTCLVHKSPKIEDALSADLETNGAFKAGATPPTQANEARDEGKECLYRASWSATCCEDMSDTAERLQCAIDASLEAV
ncbi:hypothetical protein SLS60_010070 [Paraconiothyrium brasiliense]|uniref:Uncharacterized protein n=1 Tax=Paraconiothyrium brasiliense TaxID=300254 RepID=A0ABR3QQF7_9PLEO